MKGTLISIYWVVWKFQQKTSQDLKHPQGWRPQGQHVTFVSEKVLGYLIL